MTCMKVQSLITPFINNQLNMKDMQEFIDHVESCPECMEELEVYYALLTAMKQLDEDKNLSDDYRMELAIKLEKAQNNIIHVKFTYYRKKGALLLIILLIAFIMSFRYTGYSRRSQNLVTESTFRLRTSFQQNEHGKYEADLKKYMEEHDILK